MTTALVPAVFHPEVVQAAMMKRAEEMSFEEGLYRHEKRLKDYGREVETDATGSRRRKHLQSLGMLTSALVGSAGGALIGAIMGGSRGAKIGGAVGLAGSLAANVIGQHSGYEATPRTRQEQMAYTNGSDGTLAELLVPGVAGYQRGRRWRHVDDTVRKEFSKYKVSPING